MVALLTSLKWRLLCNSFRGSPGRVVSLIMLTLMLWGFAAAALFLLLATRTFAVSTATLATVLGLAVLTVGWWCTPVVLGTSGQQVPLSRFALFPVSGRQLRPGLLLASVVNVGAPVLGGVWLAQVVTWSRGWLEVLAAAVGATMGVAHLVLGAAVVAAWVGRKSDSRVGAERRDVLLGVVFLAGMLGLSSWMSYLVRLGGLVSAELAQQVTTWVSWTPLGAAWALPASVAAGHFGVAAGQVGVAGATVVALWWGYGWSLDRLLAAGVLTGSVQRTRRRRGRVRFGGTSTVSVVRSMQWCLLRRDSRYHMALFSAALPMVFFGVVSSTSNTLSGNFVVGMGVMFVSVWSTSMSNLLGYEGTAVATQILAGVPGRVELWGRLSAFMVVQAPVVFAFWVFACWRTGFDLAWLGLAFAVPLACWLGGSGVAAWLSAKFPFALPLTTKGSLLGGGSGAGFAAGMLSLCCTGALAAVPLTVAVLGFWWPAASVVAVVLGAGIGIAVLLAGVTAGGRILTASYPEVLPKLVARE